MLDGVVHTYLIGGFNEQGIREYERKVLAIIPKTKSWALVDHPLERAGLTPEAMKELNRVFKRFIELGCCVIVANVGSSYAWGLQNWVLHDLNVPTFVTEQQDVIEDILANQKRNSK